MAAFEYDALDTAGRRRKGVVSAESARLARRELKRRKLLPMRLEAAAERTQASVWRLNLPSPGMTGRDTALFTRQLATLLAAGAPLEEAIHTLAMQGESKAVQRTLLGLRGGVLEGRRLSDAMSGYPRAFPPLYRSLVAAAEGTGALDGVLARLADYLERGREMQRKLANALVYPAVLALTAAGVVTALMVFVIPRVVEQFDSLGHSLPALTRAVIAISSALEAGWPVLMAGMAAAGAGTLALWRREDSRRRIEAAMLRLPLIGRLIRAVSAARMARTLSVLVGAGVPLVDGLAAARTTMRSLLMQESLGAVASQVREGSSLAAALRRSGSFPPLVVYMAAVGERSGQLGPMLETAAAHLEGEFESVTQTAVSLLEPAIIIAMGAVVGLIVLSILLPILQLNTLTLM